MEILIMINNKLITLKSLNRIQSEFKKCFGM